MNFDQWMQAVDAELLHMVGTTSADLPDYLYYDSFEEGISPVTVAYDVMVENDIPC